MRKAHRLDRLIGLLAKHDSVPADDGQSFRWAHDWWTDTLACLRADDVFDPWERADLCEDILAALSRRHEARRA